MKNILVVCTGNSCRSIMAEALLNHLGAGTILAYSAGSTPAGFVHPKSIAALKRNDIACLEPASKSWHEFTEFSFDVVLTVCDSAANESCPVFAGNYRKMHWSIPDPAGVQGSEQEIDKAFDDTFLLLRQRIEAELL